MMTEAERRNSNYDTKLFHEMMDTIKRLDWSSTCGVKDMIAYGWEYEYNEGLVDETPHYTRYEEDVIRFKKGDDVIQINLSTGTVVIQDLSDTFCYGAPTIFILPKEMMAIAKILSTIDTIKNCAESRLCQDTEIML